MHQEEITGKQRFMNSLNSFLAQYSKILIIISVLLVIAIISIAVSGTFKSEKNEESALAIEKIQTEYTELLTEKGAEAADEDFDKIIASLDSVIAEYPSYYAEQRAVFMKGDIYFSRDNFEKAAASFKEFAEKFPKTYLAPIALYNSAVCSEELGKSADAVKIYESVKDKYSDSYPDIAGILFSIGRLSESANDYDKALASYNDIVDNYTNSGWTNFARDRIIYLKASDLVK